MNVMVHYRRFVPTAPHNIYYTPNSATILITTLHITNINILSHGQIQAISRPSQDHLEPGEVSGNQEGNIQGISSTDHIRVFKSEERKHQSFASKEEERKKKLKLMYMISLNQLNIKVKKRRIK